MVIWSVLPEIMGLAFISRIFECQNKSYGKCKEAEKVGNNNTLSYILIKMKQTDRKWFIFILGSSVQVWRMSYATTYM